MTLPATQAHRDVLQTASSEAARSEAASLMEAIVRLTADPQFNPDGIERMMALYERQADREAQAAFNDAMARAQSEMEPVRRDASNPQTRSKYASYYALDKSVRPIYSKYGFSLSFNTGAAEKPEDIRVICYAARTGYTREYHIDMPADGKGAKGGDVMTRTHATGSAVTYGKRYLVGMIFNIAVADDDDGNAAGRTRPAPPRATTESQFITPAQVDELCALLDRSPERVRQFRRVCLDGGALEDISASSFGAYKERILDANAKRARQAPQGPAEPFSPQGAPSLRPRPLNASTGKSFDPRGVPGIDYDQDTGEVTAPPRPTQQPRPTRPSATTPAQSAVKNSDLPSSKAETSSIAAPATGKSQDQGNGFPQEMGGPDLDWMELANTLIEEAPDFATASLPTLMKWQSQLFELMPDKETAAETHYEHIRERMRDIPWAPSADALQGAWNLLMKRFD